MSNYVEFCSKFLTLAIIKRIETGKDRTCQDFGNVNSDITKMVLNS